MKQHQAAGLFLVGATFLASMSCSVEQREFQAQELPAQAGDQLLPGDDRAPQTNTISTDCHGDQVVAPPGHAYFASDKYVQGENDVALMATLDSPPATSAVLRVYATISTELEQDHQTFDFPTEGSESQELVIPFSDLNPGDLRENHGTLAFTVRLVSDDGQSTLHAGPEDNGVGFHLKFHRSESGTMVAYLPELQGGFAEEWSSSMAHSIALHSVEDFAPPAAGDLALSDPEDADPQHHPVAHEESVDDDDHDQTTNEQMSAEEQRPEPSMDEYVPVENLDTAFDVSDRQLAIVPGIPKNVRFCPKMNCEFVDAGIGEDYWTNPGLFARPMYGAYYKVYQGTSLLKTGYLEEDDGCIDLYLPINKTYRIEVWAKAKIWGNTYQVQNKSKQTRYKSYSFTPTSSSLKTFAPKLTDSGAQERWNIFQALIRSGRKHGVGSGNTYLFRYDASYGARWSGGIGEIGPVQATRKFIISHEYGHGLQDKINGGTFGANYDVGDDADGDGNCDAGPSTPDVDCRSGTGSAACSSNGQHKMWSLEYQAAAANEGWAHFVAADVWNNDADNANCWFSYWRVKGSSGYNTDGVDCESSDPNYPTAYMRSECNTNSSWFSSRGVEIDWLRAFWDVHTNGTTHASMSTMLSWIDTSVSNTNVRSVLDTRAESFGNPLNADWESAMSYNGL